MMELPKLTQEPILWVDSTPDKDYPIRILKACRENCNCMWEAYPPNPVYDLMNKQNEERAKILDEAIALLEKAK